MSALPPVISAGELRALLDGDEHVVVLDVHRGPRRAGAGRLPGAHPVDFVELVGPPAPGAGGNPLPDEAQVQALVERWGIGEGTRVVVYADDQPTSASRVWWVLRWAGLSAVQYLDGGLAAWEAAGGPLAGIDDRPVTGGGTARVELGSLPTLDADGAEKVARAGHLLDARGPGSYVDGHIPGAVSLPGTANVTGGLLLDEVSLRALYEPHLDGAPVASYCGTGVAATLDVLALATLGIPAALYPGSWSAWSAEPDRPVAAGGDPG